MSLLLLVILMGVLASCAYDTRLPSPRSPMCAEARSIAVTLVEGAAGKASAEEAADYFLMSQEIQIVAADSWTVLESAEGFTILESGPIVIRAESSHGTWVVSGVHECLRRR